MKHFYLGNFKNSLIVILLLISNIAEGQSGKIMFTARLVGSEEVPPVTGNGVGLITILFNDDQTKMYVQGVVSQLTGPVTAAHIHTGNFGANGGVLVNFASIRTGNRFAGELPVPAGFVQKALSYGLYVNVHTAANPGGEIRGQLEVQSDYNFPFAMTGLNEVPQVLTAAVGVGNFNLVLGNDKITYNAKVTGLSGPITAAHIHNGVAGVNGPVVTGLNFSGKNLSGEIALSSLPADFLINFATGKYYVNVHTAANPGGEIRGQTLYGGDFSSIATLSGDQEVPPVTTMGSGLGFVGYTAAYDSLIYVVMITDLSGLPTAAHVHRGASGVSGPVVFGLTAAIPGVAYTATVPITAANLSDIINNNLYFNVHTAANPGGEIRGQFINNLRKGFAFDMCGSQENPKNSSKGYGAAMVSVDAGNRTAIYALMVDSLSGPATAAHIHTGAIGVNGGVKFPLAAPNVYSTGAFAVTAADVALMESGGYYVNVHTAAIPGGEIRGQVGTKILCNSTSAVHNEVFTEYKVFPNPTHEGITLRFTNKEAFSGNIRITDISGRVVVNQAPSVIHTGVQELYMPLDNLEPGVYYLYLENSGRVVLTQPVVKM
jgi:hypothetical protein